MTALEARKEVQRILGAAQDGQIGPQTLAALHRLVQTPNEQEWPFPAQETASGEAARSQRFIRFMPFIYNWEGRVYENDPDDNGGATKFGIDQRSHPDVNIKALTEDQATEIYWKEWQEDGCESMPSPFAEVWFNCAVNMGLGRAKQFGEKMAGEGYDARKFLDQQEAYYRHLGEIPKYAKYLHGWLNRTSALRQRFSLA